MPKLTADFSQLPLGASFGKKLSFSNFEFIAKASPNIYIVQGNAEWGIRINPGGILIEFITTTNEVQLRIGYWDEHPVKVETFDSENKSLSLDTFTGKNAFIDSLIKGEKIKKILIDTLGLEEILVSVSIEVKFT